MAGPVLEARSITKQFGGITALTDVSLQVEPGELLGVVGPNGSGKTTLLSILLGVETPTKGQVFLRGLDVTYAVPYATVRRSVSTTFQNPRVFGTLTVAENVELGLRAKRPGTSDVDRKVAHVLSTLNLAGQGDQPAHVLSVGQRKLLEFGRAAVSNPEVYLLDEPSAGVHPSLMEVISTELRVAAKKGAAAIVVSHDLPWIFALCSRVVLLASGTVRLAGTPQQVQDDDRLVEAYLT